MTARGRGNLRYNPSAAIRSGNIVPGIKISSVFEHNQGRHLALSPLYLLNSRDRGRHQAGFLSDTQLWLAESALKPLVTAKESLFGNTPDRAKAEAISQGLLLGVGALRCGIDAAKFDADTLRTNLLTWQLGKGVTYDKDASQDSLESAFSPETAAALAQISTPAAKTACGATVLFSLTAASR